MKVVIHNHLPRHKTRDAKFSSISEMETFAKGEADGSANLRIRGEWLEVHWDGKKFTYKWGKNMVQRGNAETVLKSA